MDATKTSGYAYDMERMSMGRSVKASALRLRVR